MSKTGNKSTLNKPVSCTSVYYLYRVIVGSTFIECCQYYHACLLYIAYNYCGLWQINNYTIQS